jgi:formamidopyrimidine-DNA glycosylase
VPELPDLTLYLEALRRRAVGHRLLEVRLHSPFVLRTVEPPLTSASGRTLVAVDRLGKRVVLELEQELFLVVHLMISGRFRWSRSRPRTSSRNTLVALEFDVGTLLLTEASKKRRAWLRAVSGRDAVAALGPGGVEPLEATDDALRQALRRENRTLKRALTDARLVAGIGNAYSDEILWRARLSPFACTGGLDPAGWERLLPAVRSTLVDWTEKLANECGDRFPSRVTAFREGMAVHGRYGLPCPRCGSAVQRLVYAENEANYCAICQTGGRLLADRALSRLLHGDWPKSLEELEERRVEARKGLAGDG